MSVFKQVAFLLAFVCLALCAPKPDSAGHAPLPRPGLSYGGIPYGSVSGNVAEYYRRGPAHGLRGASDIEYAPIEQFL